MYTLYYSPGSASMAVHVALLEIGARHELHQVDLDAKEQKTAEYLKLNPNGVVPTLIVDGKPYYECAALLLLLAERHPDAKLAPAPGSELRALYLQWMLHFSNTVQTAYNRWFHPEGYGATEHAAEIKDMARERIEAAWDRVEAHLAAHGPHMLGSQFSAVDLFAVMLMRWSRSMPKPATEWPALKKLAAIVKARPSWKQVYELEGLTEWA
ncbi:MAG: glutathione S-transferase family protein [Gammaproteobacteria bacterium]